MDFILANNPLIFQYNLVPSAFFPFKRKAKERIFFKKIALRMSLLQLFVQINTLLIFSNIWASQILETSRTWFFLTGIIYVVPMLRFHNLDGQLYARISEDKRCTFYVSAWTKWMILWYFTVAKTKQGKAVWLNSIFVHLDSCLLECNCTSWYSKTLLHNNLGSNSSSTYGLCYLVNFILVYYALSTHATLSEKLTFLTPDTHTYVYLSGGKKF